MRESEPLEASGAGAQHTLMELIGPTVSAVVARRRGQAEQQQGGTAHSAMPSVQPGRPVVDVLVATKDGKSNHAMIDLR
jgi:hypothetical protein